MYQVLLFKSRRHLCKGSMAMCRRRATKHSFVMTQALVTCCQRLAGQIKRK